MMMMRTAIGFSALALAFIAADAAQAGPSDMRDRRGKASDQLNDGYYRHKKYYRRDESRERAAYPGTDRQDSNRNLGHEEHKEPIKRAEAWS